MNSQPINPIKKKSNPLKLHEERGRSKSIQQQTRGGCASSGKRCAETNLTKSFIKNQKGKVKGWAQAERGDRTPSARKKAETWRG